MDWYAFVDDIMRQESGRVVTRHRLDANAPYFRDHFPGRPVLPGVLALEALVAAGRVLLEGGVPGESRWVLGSARAVRFSRFLIPGQWLVCDVRLLSATDEEASLAISGLASEDGRWEANEGDGLAVAVSGRLTLRPARAGSAWNPRGS